MAADLERLERWHNALRVRNVICETDDIQCMTSGKRMIDVAILSDPVRVGEFVEFGFGCRRVCEFTPYLWHRD